MSTAGFSVNIAIFDALMMEIMGEKDYGPAELALIHPVVRLANAFINAVQVFGNPFDTDKKIPICLVSSFDSETLHALVEAEDKMRYEGNGKMLCFRY